MLISVTVPSSTVCFCLTVLELLRSDQIHHRHMQQALGRDWYQIWPG